MKEDEDVKDEDVKDETFWYSQFLEDLEDIVDAVKEGDNESEEGTAEGGIVQTDNPPTGNNGQAGAGAIDGNGQTSDGVSKEELRKALENLDTGFSGIPDIGFGGLTSEQVLIFSIVALIILLIIYKISRRSYQNRGFT